MKGVRVKSEGVRTGSDKPIVSKEDISPSDIIGITLGYNTQQIKLAQAKLILINNVQRKIDSAAKKIRSDYSKEILRDGGSRPDKLDEILKRRDAHNRSFPHEGAAITEDSMRKSVKSTEEERAQSVGGVKLTPGNAAFVRPILDVLKPK